jgi:DNA polymerase III alpha subunit/intein/homing endonuclease
MIDFVNLHVHTTFSILDSLIEVKDLFQKVKELGQSAVAITDHGSLAAASEALKASRAADVKLIMGCEMYFLDDVAKKEQRFRHIILLAKNAIGYRNLLTLNKRGFDNSVVYTKKVYPLIDWKLLEEYKEGLICLTSCSNGIIAQLLMAKKMQEAEEQIQRLHQMFGDDLGLEVQANTLKRGSSAYNDNIEQVFVNAHLIRLGKKYNIRVVPTTNAHYLVKEDAEAHDVMLAIGSHQPKYSNFRLKYDCPDFYLKTGEEVFNFFERNYGEFAAELCANTIYFANKCEKPDWIDPKYSNPSGKELPEFPCKDEADYGEFLEWVKKQPEALQKLSEDKLFLRFRCEKNIQERVLKRVDADKIDEYYKRIETELEVLEYHGFSSYMLIVADFVAWTRRNNIAIGPGRGCLTGDTQVLTVGGFKSLQDIKIGEQVFSHSGNIRSVLNNFKFDVSNEDLLSIKLENSFGNIKLTQDHKVFACKKSYHVVNRQCNYLGKIRNYQNEVIKLTDPAWIEAKNLECGDYIYTTFPNFENKKYEYTFDLANYTDPDDVFGDKIRIKNNIINNFSIREITRQTKLSFEVVRRAKNNKLKNVEKLALIEKHLTQQGISLSEWINLPKYKYYYVNRYITLDNEFLYVLGRWVGDGCIRHNNKNGINYAFHIEDQLGINIIENFYKRIGFNVLGKRNNNKGYNLDIGTTPLSKLFQFIFPNYSRSSYTKHLPFFFRSLNEEQLKCLINGLSDSDGSLRKCSETIKTTSLQLALELKEICNLLKIVSSVLVEEKNTHNKRNNATSYLVLFSGIKIPRKTRYIYGNGYFSKIIGINKYKDQYVYDITVDQDHSYLTSSGVVHNSVGGCLVAYLLGIHQADPIKYNLIFERFHNKEKVNFPDIDLDFSNRDKVEEYCRQKYGEDHVARVSNINTITPKVYARDMARACEFGGSREKAVQIGTDIADTIPKEITTVEAALEKVPLFDEYAKKYSELRKYTIINGKYRAWATHAAGIVISKRPLTGLVPLRRDKDGIVCLEYDKDRAEENGLVKMDLLGLSTLTVIEKIQNLIRANGKEPPTYPPDYDVYDEKAYNIISNGNTFGVFQLGTSSGTIDLCRKIKPKSINDISYINSLARPSARDMRNDFILTRDGKRPFALLHPKLGRAFNNTFGFGLYEESLLFLAQDIAGWNLNYADRLRKLTKEKGKNPKKVAEWRAEFIADAVKNDVNEEIAKRIWDEVISNFSGYGFNFSHSTFYSMLAFVEAQLKAHFPMEFLLGKLMEEVKSNAPNAATNILKIKSEIRALKIKIIPPDINKSELRYVIHDNKLITGLDAIKYVSDEAIKDIISKRPFHSFQDFMSRISSKVVRANAIQAFAASGCLDTFEIPRHLIFLYCSDYRKKLQVWVKKHDPATEEFIYPWPNDPNWTIPQTYAMEQFYLGEAFVCKMRGAYGDFFKDGEFLTIAQTQKMPNKTAIKSMKAVVRDFFEFRIKKETSKYLGQAMIKATIEDINGDQCGLTIFPDRWKMIQERIQELGNGKFKFEEGVALHFSGSSNLYEDELGIILNDLYNFHPIPQRPPALDLKAKKINLKLIKKEEKEVKEKNINDPGDLFEEIEGDLIDEGLIDDTDEDED